MIRKHLPQRRGNQVHPLANSCQGTKYSSAPAVHRRGAQLRRLAVAAGLALAFEWEHFTKFVDDWNYPQAGDTRPGCGVLQVSLLALLMGIRWSRISLHPILARAS